MLLVPVERWNRLFLTFTNYHYIHMPEPAHSDQNGLGYGLHFKSVRAMSLRTLHFALFTKLTSPMIITAFAVDR